MKTKQCILYALSATALASGVVALPHGGGDSQRGQSSSIKTTQVFPTSSPNQRIAAATSTPQRTTCSSTTMSASAATLTPASCSSAMVNLSLAVYKILSQSTKQQIQTSCKSYLSSRSSGSSAATTIKQLLKLDAENCLTAVCQAIPVTTIPTTSTSPLAPTSTSAPPSSRTPSTTAQATPTTIPSPTTSSTSTSSAPATTSSAPPSTCQSYTGISNNGEQFEFAVDVYAAAGMSLEACCEACRESATCFLWAISPSGECDFFISVDAASCPRGKVDFAPDNSGNTWPAPAGSLVGLGSCA